MIRTVLRSKLLRPKAAKIEHVLCCYDEMPILEFDDERGAADRKRVR